MAAPPSKTLRNLGGTWVMNKALSDSPDAALALQGIGWLTRKAIGLATVTLHVKEYVDDAGITHVDIQQTATGGLKGTTENRTLDDTFREHSDWLFGKVRGRNKWTSSLDEFKAEPFFAEAQWEAGTSEWVSGYVESVDNGWTTAMLWGFQVVAGERRYCRQIIMKNGDKQENFRMVFDFVSEQE